MSVSEETRRGGFVAGALLSCEASGASREGLDNFVEEKSFVKY